MARKVEELTRRLEQSEQQIRFLREENQVLKKENAELRAENVQLKTDIEILRTQNVSLKAEVTELRARIDSNSQNSNKPPSSDGYKKNTVKPAFPKAKGNKQGGQQGHKGHTMQQVSTPDIIVTCKPEQCGCGHRFSQDAPVLAEKRQVFDLPQPKLDVTEYQIFKISCSPFKKIQLLFRDLFGYAINESTMIAGEAILTCQNPVMPFVARIFYGNCRDWQIMEASNGQRCSKRFYFQFTHYPFKKG